jgi:futalosine hydrolase
VERVLLVVAATECELSHVDGAETLVCGIGPVEAAVTTARALAARAPDAVVHVGIAGAVTLEPPALVVGSEAVYADVADVAARFPVVDRVRASPELVAAARRALPAAHLLPIATSAGVGGGAGYEVEAMEGFGVLRAAQLAGVPAVELRAVSNLVGDSDRALWRIDDALAALADATRRVLAELSGGGAR